MDNKKPTSSSVAQDVLTITLISIAVLGLSIQFQLYEKLVNVIFAYKGYFLEEVIFTLITMSVFFALFSYRRWRELKKEIEEHSKAEVSRLQSELRSEALLTSIPNLTFRIRRDGVYLDFRIGNPDDLYGDPDEIIGRNISDHMPKETADLIMMHIERALNTNTVQTYEYGLEIKGRMKHFQARMIACGTDEVFVLIRNLEDSDVVSAALAQSETRFREVVESLSEGLTITDLNDNVVYMNQRMSELSGWKFSEVKNTPAYSFLLPQEHWIEIQRRNKDRRLGFAERYELEMLRKDKSTFWAEVYGSPLREVNGNIIGTIGTITDITERKWNERLQSALYRITDVTRRSQDLQQLFGNLHQIIGELMYAKNFYIALYDPASGLISFPYFVDEVDAPPVSRKFSHGSTEYILETGNILHAPAPVFDEMSEQGDLDLIGAPAVDWLGVPLMSGGKAFGVMTIQSYDPKIVFTEREKEILIFVSQHIASAIQQKSEEDRFRAVWNHSSDGMRVTDKDGHIIMVNNAYCTLVKKSREELIGQLFQSVYKNTDEELQNSIGLYKEHFAKETIPNHLETSIQLANNEIISIEMSTSYITFGINERMLLSIFRDITERKKMEDQLLHAQKMDSIGVLAGGIAHDFNNVLAMILGSAELVKHKAKNYPDILKFAQMIASAAERGSGIAKQLLMFARTEKGVMKPLSLSSVALDVCKLLEHSIPKTVSIRTEFLTGNDVIMGDEDQLHQVIINLAVNSRDAIEQTKMNGVLMFTVGNISGAELKKIYPTAEDKLYVSLKVSDTGCGMDEATVKRMYEPFFSTKERGKGTGLGLAIVHGIVKTHFGMIDVQSTVGKGTSFTLYFPATHIVEEFQKSEPVFKIKKAASNGMQSKKIMIVDDEKDLCDMLKEILETEGYVTLVAHDGVEALKIYETEKQHIGIIISDLGMPNMDGRELIRELKKRETAVQFIFMTGYLDKHSKTDLFELGTREVLLKPFSSEDVLAALNRVTASIQAG